MPKLPHPPTIERLRAVGLKDPDVVAVAPHTTLWRLHRTVGTHVQPWNALRHYGPLPDRRFEPHDPPPHEQVRGVSYLALDIKTCVAEVFQTTRLVDRHTGTPYLTGLRLIRPARLVDLTGDWPTRAGASQAINSGPRPRASEWARAIRSAFDVDGVWYRSSMHGEGWCSALFDTAADAMPPAPRVSVPLAHPAIAAPLARAAAELGYGLL
ncbi:MAG: RES family NAD+ phosphorylase [Pseudonocardiales bacterium]